MNDCSTTFIVLPTQNLNLGLLDKELGPQQDSLTSQFSWMESTVVICVGLPQCNNVHSDSP